MKNIAIKEALQFGWKTTIGNFWFFAGLMLVSFGISQLLPSIFSSALGNPEDFSLKTAIIWVVSFLLASFVRFALTRISLQTVDKEPLVFQNYFFLGNMFWPYVIASVVYYLAVSLGFVLLIIPGIIIGLTYMFYAYVMVDRNLEPIPALKDSSALTKGVRLQLLGFVCLIGLINIAGALAFGIGLLWSVPTTLVAVAHVYRQLSPKVLVTV